jgi:hypothetical protein
MHPSARSSALSLLLGLAAIGCSGSSEPASESGASSAPTAAVSSSAPQPAAAGTGAVVQPSASAAANSSPAAPAASGTTPASAAGAAAAVVPQAGAAAPAAPSGGVSYHKDIRPIIETSCLDCHVAGGIGPFPLDSWMAVKSASPTVVGAVTTGVMPPTYWNSDCQKLHDDRGLSKAQKDLFTQWKDAGYPEGSELEYKAPPRRTRAELGTPSISMEPKEAYTPPVNADEYRCFVLDSIPKESYVTGMQIIPLQGDEVHHVIVYRVAPAQLAQAQQLDDADSAPGYLCSGGAMVQSQNMFSYRPGSEPVTFQPGDAAYMEAGSALIIQVHFNTQFLAKGKGPTPDKSKVVMWTLPEGKLPDRVVYRTTTFGQINMPAGEAHYVSSISYPMSQLSTLSSGGLSSPFGGTGLGAAGFIQGEVIGMTPHAHQLAKEMHASLKHADGTTTCLDDVKWDFHWQFDYMFEKGVTYSPNDTFTADCVYDNSPANQPVIDGQRQQPRNVTFGERTIDEMCEHYIWLRFDRAAFLKARSGM